MRFPEFALESTAGGTVRRDDLLGRPWVAYLARHPGWSVCRRHLRRAAEALEAEPGIDLVIFANAKLDVARDYDHEVLADPRAEVYEALGTKRTSPVPLLAKSIGGGLRSLREGMLPRATRADMLRLGADVAVDAEGEIALLHVATSADDRLPPEELVAALR